MNHARIIKVRELLLKGEAPNAIIIKTGASPSCISKIRKKLGISPFKRGRKIGSEEEKTLNRRIAFESLLLRYKTWTAVSKKIGISRQRIDQIRFPEKHRARACVQRHLKLGKIKRPMICEGCESKSNLHGHHDDYSKPLNVRWLCLECHGEVHALERQTRFENLYKSIFPEPKQTKKGK